MAPAGNRWQVGGSDLACSCFAELQFSTAPAGDRWQVVGSDLAYSCFAEDQVSMAPAGDGPLEGMAVRDEGIAVCLQALRAEMATE